MHQKKHFFIYLIFILTVLVMIWLRGGFGKIYLDTDFARDLNQYSNLYLKRVVWLGPWLSIGFNTSPIHYYIFFPGIGLSGGNARGVILESIILSTLALGYFGYKAFKKWGKISLIAVLLIGVAPFWQQATLHPGNGFTYVIWLFLALTTLFFDSHILLSALFLGLALADHPASLVILPILIYKWFRRNQKVKNLLFIILGLALPWTPIFLFEYITKGFLTRQFLAHPNVSVLEFRNILPHYLFGITCLIYFVFVVVLLQKSIGKKILIVWLILTLIFTLTQPIIPAARSIPKIETVVTKFLESGVLNKQQKVALVSALPNGTAVPQADDYRFFLRVKRINVLDVYAYSKADVLVMFIELPDFDYKNWSTWEIDQFGSKKELKQLMIDGIKIIIFQKG